MHEPLHPPARPPSPTPPACHRFLEGVEAFDAAAFGVAPSEALLIDPQQRMMLEVGWAGRAGRGGGLDATLWAGGCLHSRPGLAAGTALCLLTRSAALARLRTSHLAPPAHPSPPTPPIRTRARCCRCTRRPARRQACRAAAARAGTPPWWPPSPSGTTRSRRTARCRGCVHEEAGLGQGCACTGGGCRVRRCTAAAASINPPLPARPPQYP